MLDDNPPRPRYLAAVVFAAIKDFRPLNWGLVRTRRFRRQREAVGEAASLDQRLGAGYTTREDQAGPSSRVGAEAGLQCLPLDQKARP